MFSCFLHLHWVAEVDFIEHFFGEGAGFRVLLGERCRGS